MRAFARGWGVAARAARPVDASRVRCIHATARSQDTYPITMPALSPTMTEGALLQWHKSVGDEVSTGDLLFDIETDKATMAVESTEDGFLATVLIEGGSNGVPINTVVGLLVEASDEKPDMSLADAALPAAAPAAETLESSAAATPAATLAAASGSVKPLSPAVLALVNLYALDPAAIPASGPKGHILKGDVLAFIGDAPPPTVQPSSPLPTAGGAAAAVTGTAGAQSAKEVQEPQFIDIPVTTMRRVIAQRLTESKTTIPHSYTQMDVDVTELLALRTQMLEEQGLKFSVNDVIVKASALALRTVPIVNSHFLNDEIVPLTSVDISIAVATESGLITPIIPDADGRSVFSISSTIRELAGRARKGTLMPHEYQGGSFTISNLGMMGIKSFSAVINPPQACILAVGGNRPKVMEDHSIRQVTTFIMSSDARVCDDEAAIKWLNSFKLFMENPRTLIN